MRLLILTFALFFNPFSVAAQAPSIQDCLGAIPICQQVYEETRSPIGSGNVNEVNPQFTCVPMESNSIWYVFTVNQSGQFGFLLTPNDPNDDYDWVLFDITDASCEDIYNDPSLLVSCNAAGDTGCNGDTGATGDSEYAMQGANCGNFPPNQLLGYSPFNALIDVEAGNTYVLMLNNFSASSNGYSIDFGLSSDIGIFDETPPVMESAGLSNSCDGTEIDVRFSEFIQCATIDAGNFSLTGPGAPYTVSLSSTNCDAGGNFSKDFRLGVSPAVPAGQTLQLALDVDGATEALDLCDNPAAPVTFDIAGPGQSGSIDLGNDTTLCEGQTVVLDAGSLDGDYQWSDGSGGPTLEVGSPGEYAVTVTTACGAVSDTLMVRYTDTAAPPDLGADTTLCTGQSLILDATAAGGVYRWEDGTTAPVRTVDQPGRYAVTVTSACGTASDSIRIDFANPIEADIRDTSLCGGRTLTWDVNTPGAAYEWQDGSTGPTFTVDQPGDYSVRITSGCETVLRSATVQLTGEAPVVDLGPDTSLCEGERLTLDASFEGAAYLWQDGSTGPTYTVDQAGEYIVTVSNGCGEAQDAIRVDQPGAISIDLGPDTVLCTGESLLLDATAEHARFYRWQDNSPNPTFLADEPGEYAVVAGNDCEEITASLRIEACETCTFYIPSAFSPNGDGINDRFRPEGDCLILNYDFKVFDRWGGLRFESLDPEIAWDGFSGGQSAGSGVYLWTLTATIEENQGSRTIRLSGDVTVIR